jgi:hypothetical protein
MTKLELIRASFRKANPKTAGEDGEKYAEKWLHNSGLQYEKIEQGKFSLSNKLKSYGGKRPDFIASQDDEKYALLIDAKHHKTNNCKTFSLKDAEIGKYRGLECFIKEEIPGLEFDVVFMVFPKECNGGKFIFVLLSEFNTGEATTIQSDPATEINLENLTEFWIDL